MLTKMDGGIGLPHAVKEIFDSLASAPAPSSNLNEIRTQWAARVERVRLELPEATIEADGEILHFGDLSPGCRACKSGTWDCIFLGMACNLDCDFCYSPGSIPAEHVGSAFGHSIRQIVDNHTRTTITGVSFTGGEPFLDNARLLEWVSGFRRAEPDRYFWIYTNGLLADPQILRQLGGLGVDEIRFNAAATGYTNKTVLRNIGEAARHVRNVTVEIPSVPRDAGTLLPALRDWTHAGVRFLNLHELIYEPGTRSASMDGPRQVIRFQDGHRSEYHPESRLLTHRVMREVAARGLPLMVNDCSMQSKMRQVRGRRRVLAPLSKTPAERLVGDDTLETYCLVRSEQDHWFCHPDAIADMRARHPECRAFRLRREAPLFLDAGTRWIAAEEC